MKPIAIRDLETGKVLDRFGATAHELLMSREPEYERDENGDLVLNEEGNPVAILDDEGQPIPTSTRRFCRVGAEPRAWKEAQAAKAPAPADETDPDNEVAAGRKRSRKRGT
jgi:hypothetical protein